MKRFSLTRPICVIYSSFISLYLLWNKMEHVKSDNKIVLCCIQFVWCVYCIRADFFQYEKLLKMFMFSKFNQQMEITFNFSLR